LDRGRTDTLKTEAGRRRTSRNVFTYSVLLACCSTSDGKVRFLKRAYLTARYYSNLLQTQITLIAQP